MAPNAPQALLGRLKEWRDGGLSTEEIVVRITTAEPETIEFWVRGLVEIALESPGPSDGERKV